MKSEVSRASSNTTEAKIIKVQVQAMSSVFTSMKPISNSSTGTRQSQPKKGSNTSHHVTSRSVTLAGHNEAHDCEKHLHLPDQWCPTARL